ncbi:MAG: hypothetical protein JWL97_3998, partial [Gemmatimonadales bacterium]|nr:hypothetical protein [Gemmatimonadales bacterium]
RQSVNQILHLFERRGYLRLEGHTLIVKDLEALRRRAGSPAPDVLRSRSPREPAD